MNRCVKTPKHHCTAVISVFNPHRSGHSVGPGPSIYFLLFNSSWSFTSLTMIEIIMASMILEASVTSGQLILLITWETGTIRLQSAAETIFNKHIIKTSQELRMLSRSLSDCKSLLLNECHGSSFAICQ